MAITDNKFDAPELEAALTANPTLAKEITNVLTARKMVVRDETQEKDFLTNYETQVTTKLTSKHATDLEKDVLEMTGIAKLPNEKYYEYYKRATTEKLAGVTKMQEEIDLLKSKHNPSEVDKARIKKLEEGLLEKTNEFDTKLKEAQGTIHSLKNGSIVEKALSSYRSKYKKDLSESVIGIVEQAVTADLMKVLKIQDDGAETILNDKGEVTIDPKTYKPLTAQQWLGDKLKDLLDEKLVAEGTGTGAGDANDKDKKEMGKFAGIPAGVTTRVQLTEHLLSIGILQGTPEFDKVFALPEVHKLKLR